MSGLKGKIVLITGASSGIGAGTAVAFAKLGCKVALVARNETKLKEVSAQCTEAGAEEVFIAPHDLGKSEECVKAVEETVAKFGGRWFMPCLLSCVFGLRKFSVCVGLSVVVLLKVSVNCGPVKKDGIPA